jgi:hypothetical protein
MSVSARVAICSGFEWGTKIPKWGTCEVQYQYKWGTSTGYAIFFLVTSNVYEKSVLKSIFSYVRDVFRDKLT